MSFAAQYRKLATGFRAQARRRPAASLDFERLARAYLHLAEQAEKNELTDLTYEALPLQENKDSSAIVQTPPSWFPDPYPNSDASGRRWSPLLTQNGHLQCKRCGCYDRLYPSAWRHWLD